jgi:hypothetical protein
LTSAAGFVSATTGFVSPSAGFVSAAAGFTSGGGATVSTGLVRDFSAASAAFETMSEREGGAAGVAGGAGVAGAVSGAETGADEGVIDGAEVLALLVLTSGMVGVLVAMVYLLFAFCLLN